MTSVRAMLACLAGGLLLAGCGRPPLQPDPGAPPPPGVAQRLGKRVSDLMPLHEGCVGNVDAAKRSGENVDLAGWAWDQTGGRSFPEFLVTDPTGIIIGGGPGGAARPDVKAARPQEVTDERVGYAISARSAAGEVTVFGVRSGAESACRLGVAQPG